MRAKPHLAAALTVLTAAYFATHAAQVPAAGVVRGQQATETVDPEPSGTPVVDPAPPPVPLHLPVALRHHDFKAPGPVVAAAQGYLAPLASSGRTACDPATHLLREADHEGAAPVVVAYALRPDDPSTALDLFMGSFVELTGIEGLSPGPCPFTTRSLGVDRVRVLDHPGGPPRPTPRSGT